MQILVSTGGDWFQKSRNFWGYKFWIFFYRRWINLTSLVSMEVLSVFTWAFVNHKLYVLVEIYNYLVFFVCKITSIISLFIQGSPRLIKSYASLNEINSFLSASILLWHYCKVQTTSFQEGWSVFNGSWFRMGVVYLKKGKKSWFISHGNSWVMYTPSVLLSVLYLPNLPFSFEAYTSIFVNLLHHWPFNYISLLSWSLLPIIIIFFSLPPISHNLFLQ